MARRGEQHHKARLTAKLVAQLRMENAHGLGYTKLARKHKLPRSTVQNAVSGRTWYWEN